MSALPNDDDAIAHLFQGKAVTEDQAALIFAEKYAGQLAYCHTEGCWREWSGSVWAKCETPIAFTYARRLARWISSQSSSNGLMKLRTVEAITTFGARDERLAKSASAWNSDPWLLGTPAGTVSLTTGKVKVSDPEDYITRSTAVAASQTAHCPRWIDFLMEATDGDEELIRFLQQIAGYALTGSAREQSLFFIYGPGGNGKGIFVNTIAAILGSYATTAAMNTFTASKNERHSTDLAMLHGARLVTASETAQGQRWDQQKIAALTGEDTITARFMRKDYFSYKPEFTLIIVGNYKPALASVDEAMRRRFNIIPFERKPATPDRDLYAKLKPEWPGILRWMIEGCLDWQKEGLQRAQSVVARTEQYFYDEDTVHQWLNEHCEVDQGNPLLTVRSSDLFRSWVAFCKVNEEYAGNAKTFKSMMEKAGFGFKRMTSGVLALGVRLKPDYLDDVGM
jgi:putative DNA primase/helicase